MAKMVKMRKSGVNNWANGWRINGGEKIVIVFLPQLLQFLGFGILGVTFYYIYKIGS